MAKSQAKKPPPKVPGMLVRDDEPALDFICFFREATPSNMRIHKNGVWACRRTGARHPARIWSQREWERGYDMKAPGRGKAFELEDIRL